MNEHDRLARAAERFADKVHEDVSTQVRIAWALERDRMYAELAELRDEVHTLAARVEAAIRVTEQYIDRDRLHSVKVPE